MPTYVYVAAQDDNKVSVFTMDAGTGKLTPKAEVSISDGPHLLAISPDRKVIYVGQRGLPGISSWRIDHNTCLLYTSPSPRDKRQSRMPSSA